METTAVGRGGPTTIPTQPSRKEWRAVSDHHSVRNVGDEELERSKLGQSEERTIYEVQQGSEPLDVDFCSITIDGSLDYEILQQRLHEVARKRVEMQHIEIDLRAQIIARSEMIEMQNSFDEQIKEHANAASKLQEQLHERDQTIHELERKLDDKERELHAIKLDSEAAWAKEDLLREQNKELASFRRERDHSEAERSQHIKQIHELQEHIQDKERQFLDLQDQKRAIQETILYKDEQIREAQTWITRVQEMDVLQSTTLQAELRERTEQYNQLWLGCQRQFADMERVHLHAIQQLQLELAESRERNGSFTEESSRLSQENTKDASQYGQNDGNHLEMNGPQVGTTNVALPNGNPDNAPSFASSVNNASTQIDYTGGVTIPPSSILGMPSYLPPAQLTALHPFVMHQHVPQSHVGHFQSVPAISSLQQWHNQQVGQDVQTPAQSEITSSQADQNLMRSDRSFNYDMFVNGQAVPSEYLNIQIGQGSDPGSMITSSTGEAPPQVHDSLDNRGYLVASQTEQELQQISSQFQSVLGLTPSRHNKETEVKEQQTVMASMDGGLSDDVLTTEKLSSAVNTKTDASTHSVNFDKATVPNATETVLTESFVSSEQTVSPTSGRVSEITLLDERSLLACVVRTIPAGGRIRISSTLPNRLGKMLAPLHWHDYKKKFGKLDDFVASHPEIFVVEDDHIQLREGAQKMVAANAAAAKVAAAAAASSPYSSSLPSVAVTPMAQNRHKKSQQPNGVHYGVSDGLTLTDSKTLTSSQTPMTSIQNSGSSNGKFVAKQRGRSTSATFPPRR